MADLEKNDTGLVYAEEGEGVYVHRFEKPFTWEGRTYETLTFDFERLTGRDSIEISRELAAKSLVPLIKEMSADYQVRIAARACRERVGADVLINTPILEFNRICNHAKNFLIGLG